MPLHLAAVEWDFVKITQAAFSWPPGYDDQLRERGDGREIGDES